MIERRHAVAGALLLAAGLQPAAWAAPLSFLEAKGKALYFTGTGSNGKPVKAYIGEESSAVDADALPCAGCHGEDGRGRPEGGIFPTDITWSYLTKPYGHRHGSYRRHPAFNEKTLAAALAQGIDPAGNPLDPAMPRFVLNKADLRALIAYLQRLDAEPAPGIEDTVIHLATILPLEGHQEAVGRDMQALLEAYFAEINAGGGIFNRRIELGVIEMGDRPEPALTKLRKLMDSERVFALLSPYAPGLEPAMTQLAEQTGTPLIGPVADFPESGKRSVFYLFDGLERRALALLDHAGRDLKVPRLSFVYPAEDNYRRVAARLAAEIEARAWPKPLQAEYTLKAGSYDMAQALRTPEADAVLFLGTEGALKVWMEAGGDAQRQPPILFAGIVAGKGILALPAASPILLALPFTPESAGTEAMETLRTLQRKAGVGDRSLYPEAYALAGAQLLIQALKQAGRGLSRQKLLTALESLSGIQVGPLPPMSFAPSRHMGNAGFRIVAIDPQTRRFVPLDASP